MKKPNRTRTAMTITLDPVVLRELRAWCDKSILTYSGYIEDLVAADLKSKGRI